MNDLNTIIDVLKRRNGNLEAEDLRALGDHLLALDQVERIAAIKQVSQNTALTKRDINATLTDAKRREDDLRRAENAVAEARGDSTHPDAPVPQRPVIQGNRRELRDVVADGIDALVGMNEPPRLFAREREVVTVLQNTEGRSSIALVSKPALRNQLSQAADWRLMSSASFAFPEPGFPPQDVVAVILAEDNLPFPELRSVVECPVLRADGTILDVPGYDSRSQLFYAPTPGLNVASISPNPSERDVREARGLLDELTADFPFVDDASRANALALLLTPIVRPAIDGSVPLALLDKPRMGTGASLLAEVVVQSSTGRPAAMMGAVRYDDEWRKQLTAVLLEGPAVVVIDNVDFPLWAPSLSRALTARTWKDRLLGHSRIVEVPQLATWIATGNNLVLQGDLPRRCYWVRMDAEVSRPWERQGFRHPDLLRWVAENRGRLLAALLTIAWAWFAAERPKASTPVMGGFQEWTSTVGGMLAYAGVHGFLGNAGELWERSAEGEGEWEAFLVAWEQVVGDEAITTKRVIELLDTERGRRLREALPEGLAEAFDSAKPHAFASKLGRALTAAVGVRYGDRNLHLEDAGKDPATSRKLFRLAGDPSEELL